MSDLVAAMRKFIDLPAQKKKAMSVAARRHAEQYFDEKIVLDSYMATIRRCFK